jgi:hypothetical protein
MVMGKREMDDFERETMALGIQSMRERPITQYTKPGEDQKWRARDLLDIHWNLVGTACPVSFNRILSCIIGHANPTTGRCDPKQKLIAMETGYSRDTVIRAVKWAEAEGFLKSEARGLGRSKAYHPQRALFEMFWVAIAEDIETQKAASRMYFLKGGVPSQGRWSQRSGMTSDLGRSIAACRASFTVSVVAQRRTSVRLRANAGWEAPARFAVECPRFRNLA